MDIPTIKTERLILRPPILSDWPRYFTFMASSRAKYMGGPYDESSAWGQFCHDVAQWELMGHGSLMIDEQNSGTCVGQVGINHGPLFPERELGWLVYEKFEGRGYALEAAGELLEWAYDVRNFDTLVSYIDPLNVRSISLAKKLGAQLDPEAKKPDENDTVYRHNKSLRPAVTSSQFKM